MKFLQKFLPLVLFACIVQAATAQYCGNSGPTICTAGTNLTVQGFSPPADSAPCAIQGVYYNQVIQVKVPTTANVAPYGNVTVVKIKIDTISNLPCGLCWSTDNATNTFNGGSQFCIRVSGTTYDNVGQYKLHIIIAATGSVFGLQETETLDASTVGLGYYARVVSPTGTCVALDTSSTFVGNTASDTTPAPTNAVTASGPLTFCSGGSVTFTATQTAAQQYQWYNGATAIAGATGSSYTATASGTYSVQIIKNCHLVISQVQTVTVNPTPTASIAPAGPFNLCGGSTELLTATISGGATQQWYNGASSISGSTGTTYTATATGSYYVIATQGGCADTSNKVSVTISGTPLSPTITANKTSECAGAKDTLNAGGGYSSYIWSGALGTSQYAYPLGGGTYTVTVANGACTGSASVVISTLAATPVPTLTPSGTITICQGTGTTLQSSTAGSYVWTSNGHTVSIATTQSITVDTAGIFIVTTNNGCGSAVSTADTVVVNPKPNGQVTPAGPIVVCGGGSQLLTASGGGTYQWLKDSTVISGQTGTTYTAAATGYYSCIVTKNGCTDTSNLVYVQITGSNLTPVITPARTFVCPTGADTLDAGTGYTSYLWSPGGATTHYISITAANTYSVTVHNGACSGTASINIAAQAATPTPTVTPQGPTTFCQGGSVTLASSAASNNVWSNNGGTATSATYSASGSYTVTVNNGCGPATSAPVTVTVNSIPTAAITPAGSTLICSGGSQTLTATPSGASYVWIESGSIISGQTLATTSATTAGTYRAIVTVNGCSDTSNTATIQVSAPLTPTIQATSSTLCPGLSDTLNVGAGYSSYTWGNSLGSTQSIIVSSGGTYTITVANGSCTGSASVTISQGTATPTPTIAVTGSLNICGNDSVILTSSSPTGNVWSNSSVSQSITAYSPGIFSVTVSGACGPATSGADTVTKNPIPGIYAGPDTGTCLGDQWVLHATTTASSATWSNSITGLTDTVSTSGEYYVTVTQFGCSNTDSVHVQFDAPPSVTVSQSQDTLTATVTGASQYQWYEDALAIPGANDSVFIATASGAHYYHVSVSNGFCTVASARTEITITGISEISQTLSTHIYPNPANNTVNIAYTLMQGEQLGITLTDMTGRVVSTLYSGTQGMGEYTITTDISALSGGIYLISFSTPEGTLVRKVTKE